jgi:hypothetical protein
VITLVAACSSPLDLDVDRTSGFNDGTVSPHRVSMYYYYSDSSYEAIFQDTAILNGILIDTSVKPFRVSIKRLPMPEVPWTCNMPWTTMVKSFCISTDRQPADNQTELTVGAQSWMAVQHLDTSGAKKEYLWFADSLGRQLRVGFSAVDYLRTVKGRVNIFVVDPQRPALSNSYNAVITMDY